MVVASTPSRGGASFAVTVDAREIDRAMKQAPSVTYFWLRNFLGQALGVHRKQWLRQKGVKFGRGSQRSRAIRVPAVNQGPSRPADNVVSYQVRPQQPRFRNPSTATLALQRLRAEASTGSIALQVHQFGKDVVSRSGYMAIPFKTRGSPSEFRQRKPKAQLITLPSRRGNALLLFERQRKRTGGQRRRMRRTKTGKLARSQPKTKVDVLRLRWILTKRARMRKTLRFYETWDQQQAARSRMLANALNRIVKDISRGVTT